MEYIKTYENHEDYEVNDTPNVAFCKDVKDVHFTRRKYDKEYLTFEALESGAFTLTIGSAVTTGDVVSISYSLDSGETWTTTNNVQGQRVVITTPTVNAGDEVLWKGNANRIANNSSTNSASTFSSTANFNARGNIMSLLYGDEFKDKISLNGKDFCFYILFEKNYGLINAKNLSLPATTLANYCYNNMFHDCTNLTTAPELPATTLAISCYGSMFSICTNLTKAPKLPAVTLAQGCYSQMFAGCTSLTVAPDLPSTTLANHCYYHMFQGCASLTTAPELPATTLANECYPRMFQGCKNLTTAPELPATTLKDYCYDGMFADCINLTIAPKLPATTLANGCYRDMFQGCTSLTMAPELSATRLESSCYSGMFSNCTNLTTAPELPATTLVSYCYTHMFYNCKKIDYIKAMFTTEPSDYYTENWVYGVEQYGVFVKSDDAYWFDRGYDSIPCSWNVYGGKQSYRNIIFIDSFWTLPNNIIDNLIQKSNEYEYNGTFEYENETYYLWELTQTDDYSPSVSYILTKQRNFSGLTMKDNIENRYCPIYAILTEDFETYKKLNYNSYDYVLVAESGNSIFIDDFICDNQKEYIREMKKPDLDLLLHCNMLDSNAFEYYDTIEYDGQIFYLWNNLDSSNDVKTHVLTYTNDFSGLSLFDDINSKYNPVYCFLTVDDEEYNLSDDFDEEYRLVYWNHKERKGNEKIMWVENFDDAEDATNFIRELKSSQTKIDSYLNGSQGSYYGSGRKFIYSDEIVYKGVTYFLWEMDETFTHGYAGKTVLTETTDFSGLSLFEDDTNYYCPVVYQLNGDASGGYMGNDNVNPNEFILVKWE